VARGEETFRFILPSLAAKEWTLLMFLSAREAGGEARIVSSNSESSNL